MVCDIDRAMAVAQWHAGKIPEDQHEAPFLIIHIPAPVSLQLGRPRHGRLGTHQVDTMHSSPLEQAFAYRK